MGSDFSSIKVPIVEPIVVPTISPVLQAVPIVEPIVVPQTKPQRYWADGRPKEADLPWVQGQPSLLDPNYYFQYSPEIKKNIYAGTMLMSDPETRKLDNRKIALQCIADKPYPNNMDVRVITCGIDTKTNFPPWKNTQELAEGESRSYTSVIIVGIILFVFTIILVTHQRRMTIRVTKEANERMEKMKK